MSTLFDLVVSLGSDEAGHPEEELG